MRLGRTFGAPRVALAQEIETELTFMWAIKGDFNVFYASARQSQQAACLTASPRPKADRNINPRKEPEVDVGQTGIMREWPERASEFAGCIYGRLLRAWAK